ncbi:unnamed protein product [Lathyrus sativus]|nr:unnamed protein product [Lathyrus sativus]
MLSLSVTSPSFSTLSFLPKPLQFKTSFNGFRLRQPSTCTVPATKRTALVPVMMAKREEQLKEIRNLTNEQINQEVVNLKGDLVLLRVEKSNSNDGFNYSKFRKLRKQIARLLTVKREREIEEGISKRLSRKLDKKWKRSIAVKPTPTLLKPVEAEAA